MKWTCPKCGKIIESDIVTNTSMDEILKHEKTHKEDEGNED